MTFRDLLTELNVKGSKFKEPMTPEEFSENVMKDFKKHFPNGFISVEKKNMFKEDYISGVFGMIGNPKDNVNGIPQNDNMRHTFTMYDNGDGTWQFKGNGRLYIEPQPGSFNAMDSVKTKLGNNSKLTLEKAEVKLQKFFVKLVKLMKENKDKIAGVDKIDKKYLVFK